MIQSKDVTTVHRFVSQAAFNSEFKKNSVSLVRQEMKGHERLTYLAFHSKLKRTKDLNGARNLLTHFEKTDLSLESF